ncbi:glycine zipper 2TM domain-containing protein [Ideonella sp. YS5]|uniref:glycine zipper 2TM domain-containing protein n=1 Tax=Ideonella sp. YS5 TaxID=3453714 RepID=UPI003EE9A0A0
MKRITLTAAALAALAGLAGCMTTSPDVVHPYHAQRMSHVQDGTILSIRPVTVEGQQSGAGAVTGGVVGGIAGSSVGGPREGAVVGVIGAVAGAVIGNAIERDATRERAYEIIVQLRNGDRRAIVQAQGSEPLNVGDAVLLVTTGGRTRVMLAPAGTAPVSAAPPPPPQAYAAPAAPALPPPVASPPRPPAPPAPVPARGAEPPQTSASAPVYTQR